MKVTTTTSVTVELSQREAEVLRNLCGRVNRLSGLLQIADQLESPSPKVTYELYHALNRAF